MRFRNNKAVNEANLEKLREYFESIAANESAMNKTIRHKTNHSKKVRKDK